MHCTGTVNYGKQLGILGILKRTGVTAFVIAGNVRKQLETATVFYGEGLPENTRPRIQ